MMFVRIHITTLYCPGGGDTAWMRVTVGEIKKVETYLEENMSVIGD